MAVYLIKMSLIWFTDRPFLKKEISSLWVGTSSAINKVGKVLGEDTEEQLELDLSKFDRQRIFVSSHNVIGKKLKDLHLSTQFNATVTRLRRGDIEFLPHGDTYLSPGDQLAVISSHDQKEKIACFFGGFLPRRQRN